ncbi:hypothetical protein AMK29_14765 [Streptomyces sp. CB02261]|nr:hypothetical protein AMK29_14765 [Streptomyces sp. CB02261]
MPQPDIRLRLKGASAPPSTTGAPGPVSPARVRPVRRAGRPGRSPRRGVGRPPRVPPEPCGAVPPDRRGGWPQPGWRRPRRCSG